MKVLRLPAAGALAAVALAAIAGCTASASVGPGHTYGSHCARDWSLLCTVGEGWRCPPGDYPEREWPELSCSLPVADGPYDDFCCFEWTYGGACAPDPALTWLCQVGSFGYRCRAGEDPTWLDASLTCSYPTPDGPYDDFCCW